MDNSGFWEYEYVPSVSKEELKPLVVKDCNKYNTYYIRVFFDTTWRDVLKHVRYSRLSKCMGKYQSVPNILTKKGCYNSEDEISDMVNDLLDNLLDNPSNFVQPNDFGSDVPLSYDDLQYLTIEVSYNKVKDVDILSLPNHEGYCKVECLYNCYFNKFKYCNNDFIETPKVFERTIKDTLHYPQYSADKVYTNYVDLSNED